MSEDRSFLYGDALFETVRVEETGPKALDLHVARFARSAVALGYPDDCIYRGVAALQALAAAEPGIHRITITRDDPHAPFVGDAGIVHRASPLPDQLLRPRLTLLPGWYWPDDPLAGHKTTSYLRSIEVRRRALTAAADDALRVSDDGLVGEASASNVFVVFPSGIATPPLRGILPGTVRQRVIETFDVLVRHINAEELEHALEIVLTNAAQVAVAAFDLDGRSLAQSFALDVREGL